MNQMTKLTALLLTSLLIGFNAAADDNATAPTESTPAAQQPAAEVKPLAWNELIQKKYNLTDAQMQTLTDAKLNETHSVRVAHLAQLSNKSIEEVLKMRTETKLGWGQIAKQLNVPESEIGKAVSSLRKERNDLRKQAKLAKRNKEKTEREEKKEEKKEELAEKKEDKKEERAEKKEEKKHEHEEKRAERDEKRKEKQESREIKKAERKEKNKGSDRK
jgi:hypothetical protein